MKRKFQPTVPAALAVLCAFIVLMGMGTWQIQRLVWKNGLLAQIHSRMEQPAVPMPDTLENPDEWEYRRVTLAGEFVYAKEFLVKPRTLDGANGYHMIVPFRRASGGVVLVNRGWISDARMPKASRPKGLLQIEGIVQKAHPTSFTPANDPAKKDWYWADIPAMAAAAHLQNAAPVLVAIAVREPNVYPAGGRVEVNIRNDHRQYALFWYAMALVLNIIFFIRYWQPVEEPREELPQA